MTKVRDRKLIVQPDGTLDLPPEFIENIQGLVDCTPEFAFMKAAILTKPGQDFFEALDGLVESGDFAVTCSYLSFYLRDLSEAEMVRDFQRDAVSAITTDRLGQARESSRLVDKLMRNSTMRDRLPDFAILQPPKDHLEIKMAEDRVKYVLDRYAIQKIMAVLSESLAVDDNTQKFLAEAERRGLAAIVTVTRAFIDYSRENRQRPDLKTKRSERGFGDGD